MTQNTLDQEHRLSDETTPQDGKAMSPASAGSVAERFPDRLKPIEDDDFDRPKPIADARLSALEELSAMDQELELKHGIKGNPMIKAQRCTPSEDSVRNGCASGCETVR